MRKAFVVMLALALLVCRRGHQAAAAPAQPNIVFIFSDDHAYQAISAYGDPRKLIETPNIDRMAARRDALRPLPGAQFDLRPQPGHGADRQVQPHRTASTTTPTSRFDGSQTTFPKLLQAAGYQTAIIGKWHLVSDPTGFDYWDILPGQGVYYNPPMIRNGASVKHEGYMTDIITDLSLDWLKQARQVEAVSADVPAQGAAPRVGAASAAISATTKTGNMPSRATLFDDYAGRGCAEHEQDMTIAKTMNDKRPEAHAAAAAHARADEAVERLLRAAQRRVPPGQPARARTWCAGNTTATCTTTSAASKSVDESVGRVLEVSRRRGPGRQHASSSIPPTRAFTWASMAGSTSAGSSRNRCARRCWCAGPAWSSPAA